MRPAFVLVSAHIAASVWARIETSVLPPLKTVWAFYLISVVNGHWEIRVDGLVFSGLAAISFPG
jgi:hypothetical protein